MIPLVKSRMVAQLTKAGLAASVLLVSVALGAAILQAQSSPYENVDPEIRMRIDQFSVNNTVVDLTILEVNPNIFTWRLVGAKPDGKPPSDDDFLGGDPIDRTTLSLESVAARHEDAVVMIPVGYPDNPDYPIFGGFLRIDGVEFEERDYSKSFKSSVFCLHEYDKSYQPWFVSYNSFEFGVPVKRLNKRVEKTQKFAETYFRPDLGSLNIELNREFTNHRPKEKSSVG